MAHMDWREFKALDLIDAPFDFLLNGIEAAALDRH